MSLRPRDRQALDSITERLAGSDPALARLLNTFTRLTAGEAMPSREHVDGRGRRLRKGLRRAGRRLGPGGIMMVVWLVITVLMVSLAVVLSTADRRPCPASPTMGCAQSAPSAAGHPGPS
jgi:Protein of unknown function (DUF3040)